jgi:hypothetical protein
MKRNYRDNRCVILLATMIATAAYGNALRAQDPDDAVEDAEIRLEAKALTATMQLHAALKSNLKSQFDRWVRSEFGTTAEARRHLEILLSERFDQLEGFCTLTESQQKKLNVAANGDIKRFLERLDRIARAIEKSEIDEDEFRHQRQELRALQSALVAKVFDANSLFSKTIANTLNPEQRASYENRDRDQMVFLYRKAIVQTVKNLEGVLKLKKEQSRQFETLLIKETRPPRKFGQSAYAFVMFQASKLPEATLKSIFDDSQWRWFSAQLASWSATEDLLKTDGFIFAEAPIAAPSVVTKPVANREKIDR